MEKFKPFYVGQVVKCVDVSGLGGFYSNAKLGEEYTITSINQGCHYWRVTIGILSEPHTYTVCTVCHSRIPMGLERTFNASRFRAITEDFQAITFARIQQEEPVSMN